MLSSSSMPLPKKETLMQKGARSLLLKGLARLNVGSLSIVEYFASGEPQTVLFGAGQTELQAEIHVHDIEFYRRVLRGGSIGGAEAYIEGLWDSPNLTAVVELVAKNLTMLDSVEQQSGKIKQWLTKLGHWLKHNSVKQAKRNIMDHYDLGNDLYETFLDHHMLYSSALYLHEEESLTQAQVNKMQRLCAQLDLKPDDQVLEIGTGWGAMAIYMAQEYGCQVTTTTISEEQYLYAKEKINQAGLNDRITLLKQDYRLLDGKFDKLVSIEMIEAVGKRYLAGYLRQCQERLKPGGKMAIQAITIADQRYDYYSSNVDFIQKYIFPGGFLPSITALTCCATHHTDFVVRDLYDFGLDYGKTLHAWRERFEQQLDTIRSLGYDEKFIRLWRYYFCYCEGGFRARTISVIHMTLERPQ
ncbi:SAM-dependent methyltransferase [Vibrio nitrifigilis]|uniref:Class I SAM-dependent methyltransferase n=1 Tax=Vibrio nitrifigilis TaxID=2789781 RepID=A0ABS0GEY7_9VIBR|nr:cyclopropane-fatty-acyl-phospholipid synthase family protein [Vibrio nitrifigilis]MBF9000803.1 class I SAM-dependent methyltransferase [Vibrio nitrifigilis]